MVATIPPPSLNWYVTAMMVFQMVGDQWSMTKVELYLSISSLFFLSLFLFLRLSFCLYLFLLFSFQIVGDQWSMTKGRSTSLYIFFYLSRWSYISLYLFLSLSFFFSVFLSVLTHFFLSSSFQIVGDRYQWLKVVLSLYLFLYISYSLVLSLFLSL